jgi:hypothetical protein
MDKNIARNLASFLVLSAVITLALGSEDSSDKKAKSTRVSSGNSNAPSSISSELYSIGDKVSAPPLEIVVNSAQEKLSVGNEFFNSRPSEGATYVAINWQYKNVGKKPLSMWSKPEMKLRDAEGTEYSEDIGAASSYATEIDLDEKVISDLNPGITVKSAAVFEISKESLQNPGWKIVITSSEGEILFNLQ